MPVTRATVVLSVANLSQSMRFYRDVMGFQIDWEDETSGVAQVASPAGRRVLLAGPGAPDLSPWLEPSHDRLRPGDRFYSLPTDLPAYRDEVVRRGAKNAQYEEHEWGARLLLVPDPDGYLAAFWESVPIADEEIVRFYRLAPDRLEAALTGLAEADLDLTRAPGKWSIRQIVLHMVDSDATTLFRTKLALAEPGRLVHPNPYDQNVWAEALDYAHRPIEAEVALFRAIRAHVAGLLGHLPNALDRSIVNPKGQSATVRQMVQMLSAHALEHIEQILETRRVHRK